MNEFVKRPETTLLEAAYEAVAWSVVEVSPGAYQCRECRADVTDVNAPHEPDCVHDALRAAIAVMAAIAPADDLERAAAIAALGPGVSAEGAQLWLAASSPFLAGRTPNAVLAAGGLAEVLDAIEQINEGDFA